MAASDLRVRLNVPYAQAVENVIAALQAAGFGIMTRIDVQSALKQKLDVDFRPYIILGFCNPSLAHQALLADPTIGTMLPCNSVVYEADGGSMVEFANPMEMMALTENPAAEPVAQEARARIQRVIEALGG